MINWLDSCHMEQVNRCNTLRPESVVQQCVKQKASFQQQWTS